MKFIMPILRVFYGGGDGLTVTTTQADGTEHTVNWPGGTRGMMNDREDGTGYPDDAQKQP